MVQMRLLNVILPKLQRAENAAPAVAWTQLVPAPARGVGLGWGLPVGVAVGVMVGVGVGRAQSHAVGAKKARAHAAIRQ